MIWRETPCWDGAMAALGLALGCIGPIMPTFDMAKLLKPPAALRDIFPWGDLIGECIVMVFLAMVLVHQSDGVSKAYESAQLLCGQSKTLALASVGNLGKEKKDLTQKLDFVHKFLDSRILWTNVLGELSDALPRDMVIGNLQCLSHVDMSGRTPGGTSLDFPVTMPLTPSGAVPLDVGKFIQKLRMDPKFQQDFGTVTQSGLQRASMNVDNKNVDAVAFSVKCLPGLKGKK
jgi:hypothetical protein